ncbi:MAG TPA: cadherin-like beta sandwich domain-containing protein, partial [Prolixibacteraceae bacterium]|nr:cadherin-like beta sandwich domain-containing protein [Prolixibacteraceae bacterium]
LKTGDRLKVTAKNGSVKEYFIKINRYAPNKIARLSAITWPDVPETLKGYFGWKGDTIPGFSGTNYDYTISIPADVAGMPALVATPEQLNTTVQVHRATNLAGSLADRTVTFNTTAEDGTTKLSYKVTMNKEKALENIEPYAPDPFISEFVYRDQWANSYMEVVNPGNQVLDLSNYMFAWANINNPAEAITMQSATDSWASRYLKYIPGYKWVDQATWETQPAMVIPDPAVDPIVYPGEVFVVGERRGGGQVNATQHPWWGGYKTNVDLGRNYNPWGENTGENLSGWEGMNWYLFRIDNDSIKNGLKAASDPNDFTLIDVFGSGDGSWPVVNGRTMEQINSYTRKPNIYKGNSVFKGSFGTNHDDSEWIFAERATWVSRGYGWPVDILMICSGLGSHFMNEVTVYKSTINSVAYKVSEGYGPDETIRGVKSNTTVDDFLSRILKADEGQTLTLKNAAGNTLTGTQKLSDGDQLHVLSADSANTSVYTLSVTTKGFSSNAILTSTVYFISVDVTTGGIYLIPQGTKLTDAVANVVVPEGATLTVIDGNDAWVPYKKLNFDSTYVDVIVTDNIFFEVLAEDGLTKVTFQLVPNANASDAFVTSDLYSVDQSKLLISFVPRGTEVSTFLRNVIPVTGATIKVVDKNGLQRTKGGLYQDDMLVVTSKDGKVTKTYYLDMLRTEFLSTAYLAYVLSGLVMVFASWSTL